jgi:hypothetical protein
MQTLTFMIMQLTGSKDSWDWTSPMLGMMGGMGMGGMGMGGMGMGGGMGGMGMGGMGMGGMGMGGMGGGMRSVPATGPASALLNPKQTRNLPTRAVSLDAPTPTGQPRVPAKDEVIQLGELSQLGVNPAVSAAVSHLSDLKAPETVSQLVFWNLNGVDWRTIDRLSNRWANNSEITLARSYVDQLTRSGGAPIKGESGTMYVEVTTKAATHEALASDLRMVLSKVGLLGLKAEPTLPSRPSGPSIGCRVVITETGEAEVQLATSDVRGTTWSSSGKFTVPSVATAELPKGKDGVALTAEESGQYRAALVADGLAEGVLSRLVRAQLTKGPKDRAGKETYRIRIDNVSPLILNGLALSSSAPKSEPQVSALSGFSLPPRKSVTLPASGAMVERLGLGDGIKAVAADLSAL